MAEKRTLRGAGYIRVSTADQATRGLSLETQEAEIRRYAEAEGIELTGVYVDKGITARKRLDRREGFLRLMEEVDAERIDVIIVLRLDRWFRNVYDYHRMMNEHLLPHHVDWCAVKEQYSTKTTNGRLMINLRLSIAEQECDTDGDRIRDIQDSLIRRGQWPFGSAPSGYRIVDKRLEKDPETQACWEFFFEHLLLNGSVRAATIAMNERFGARYEYTHTHRMAKRPLYKGEYRGIQGFCPAYLTERQWDRLQYLVSKNLRTSTTPEGLVYLFSGLLTCEDCGRRLVSQTTRSSYGARIYYSYRCPAANLNRRCPNNKTLSERKIAQHLLGWLEEHLRGYIAEYEEGQSREGGAPQGNAAAIRSKQARVKELFINGLIELDEYRQRTQALESRLIPEAQTEQAPDLDNLRRLLHSDALAIYAALTREEQRAFWRGVIKNVRVYRGVILDPPAFL